MHAASTARRAGVINVWINPPCSRPALIGPPPREPIIRPGPTELVTGLYLSGGPPVLFSVPRCFSAPEKSWAGTVTVTDAAIRAVIATQTVAADRLARFPLAADRYMVQGTFAKAHVNNQPGSVTMSVTIPTGKTVRQDLAASVP
jgi:hypothetical protein